eukprot:XP_001698768.1 predicted protein [Chlamydomonas reinhardtii]
MSESVISDYGSEDVAQTIAIITQLKAENVDLKRNFDNLKGLHLQLVESNKTLQARYATLFDDRNNVEKQYQSLCESWRVELEEKQRQLDAAKAQILGPRDLEVLRVKLLEEVDAPYRAKTDNLAKDEGANLMSFVESVTRKNRHLVTELAESQRAAEDLFASNVRLQGAQTALQIRKLEDKVAALLGEAARRDSLISELKLAQQAELVKSQMTATQLARSTRDSLAAELESVLLPSKRPRSPTPLPVLRSF